MAEPRIRIARDADLAAVRALTVAACAAYEPLPGGPPGPVLEDHAPRIAADQVWVLVEGGRWPASWCRNGIRTTR